VLDPFAGGSVRGIVASRLGRAYVGVELRPEQVAANQEQLQLVGNPAPEWRQGDARKIGRLASDVNADLVFSCPPYWNLERYSDNPADLSNLDEEAFFAAQAAIIRDALGLLREDRFAVWVVGDVRDDQGF
jgi:DNA modification methylase